MHSYFKTFSISKKRKTNVSKKINEYLSFYNFQEKENIQNVFRFEKKGNYLDGWIFNPLVWEAEIEITLISEKLISINYKNFGNGQISPFAFQILFKQFYENLILFIENDEPFEKKNQKGVKQAKRKILFLFFLILIGAFLCAYLFRFIQNDIKGSMFTVIGIAIGSLLTLKGINLYYKEKYQV